mmetsp:Transcript_1766/g.3510  ORF Transcript_1766/g.3510 Transcript_1766/m.3510 type:complete len:102 (-) Transcript_1766:1444-1749(-)
MQQNSKLWKDAIAASESNFVSCKSLPASPSASSQIQDHTIATNDIRKNNPRGIAAQQTSRKVASCCCLYGLVILSMSLMAQTGIHLTPCAKSNATRGRWKR